MDNFKEAQPMILRIHIGVWNLSFSSFLPLLGLPLPIFSSVNYSSSLARSLSLWHTSRSPWHFIKCPWFSLKALLNPYDPMPIFH